MSDFIEDVYTYRNVISSVAGSTTQQGTAGELIPANSVVRFDSNNLLVTAFNTPGSFSKLAGVTQFGAASGFLCTFYPNGAILPSAGLIPGGDYYLDIDGSLTTIPVPSGVSTCIKIGRPVSSSKLSVSISTFSL